MINALDKDIVMVEQQLLNIASEIDDIIDAFASIPEDEREDCPDIARLENLANVIRESI